MKTSTLVAVIAIAGAAAQVNAAPDEHVLVVCSPGSPGTTDGAQPRMDAFAAAVGSRSREPVAAVYEPTDAGGVKRLETASMGLVSLPFFLAREKELGLHARLEAVQPGRPQLERWTLVAQKGRIAKADALAGMTIVSTAGFAPRFVRAAIAQLGPVPASVKIVSAHSVLSALRHAAQGEPVAVLLDGPQAASLGSLPFASSLEAVTTSPAWPAGVMVTVDANMSARSWAPLEHTLLALGHEAGGGNVLESLQIDHFAPLDDAALTSARTSFGRAR